MIVVVLVSVTVFLVSLYASSRVVREWVADHLPARLSRRESLDPGPYTMVALAPTYDGRPLGCERCLKDSQHQRVQIRPNGPGGHVPYAVEIDWCPLCGWPTQSIVPLSIVGGVKVFG